MAKSQHEQYIDELLSGRVSMTPREVAAANEIRALREKVASGRATPSKLPEKTKGTEST